jgi:signal transduction histidine kinase
MYPIAAAMQALYPPGHSHKGYAMDDVGAPSGVGVPSSERLHLGNASRGRMARWAVLAGLAVAAGAVALTLSSDHVRYRWGDALFLADNIAGFAAAGVYWLGRRPASLLGPALLATALVWALVALQSADNSLVFSLAVLADWPGTVATFFTLLAFPSGRLTGKLDRSVMVLVFAVLALFFLPYVLLSPVTTGGHPLAECAGGVCPPNALQMGSISPATLIDIGKAESIGGVVVGAVVCFELVRRFRAGTRPRRRALFWIVVVGVPYATLFALRQLTAFVVDAPPGVVETVRWSLAAVRLLLPWAFVASLLQGEVFAGAALERLVAGLEDGPDARRWERDVALALDDPTVRIAVWSEAEGSYLGLDGAAVRRDGAECSWHGVDDHLGSRVAVIIHDPVLDDDPELLDAAGTATLISMESGRLEREIRDSRVRLLAVAGEERRRLERDLQEGAEQRLVALRVKLGLVAAADDSEQGQLIAEIGDELDATMDDLRSLAHGIYPSLLRSEGVASALRAAARRSPLPATVDAAGVGRLPADVESVVYFSCLEAMHNAAAHAGSDATIAVRLDVAEGIVRFLVADTGCGMRPPVASGAGLTAIRERVQAVDGAVTIESHAGGGTTVRGEIPISAT